MNNVPYAIDYCTKDGKAFIDEPAAEKIRTLYRNYLVGLSLENAAREAGINGYYRTIRSLMETRHYLGDNFCHVIFNKAMSEHERRINALGRSICVKPAVSKTPPVHFHFLKVKASYDDPAEQAGYLYRLTESEEP